MKISPADLAKLLGISARSVGRYEANQVIRRDDDGEFDLSPALAAIHKHLRTRVTISERLVRQFCPNQLESIYLDEAGGLLPVSKTPS